MFGLTLMLGFGLGLGAGPTAGGAGGGAGGRGTGAVAATRVPHRAAGDSAETEGRTWPPVGDEAALSEEMGKPSAARGAATASPQRSVSMEVTGRHRADARAG